LLAQIRNEISGDAAKFGDAALNAARDRLSFISGATSLEGA
jgi:hypothetical protein